MLNIALSCRISASDRTTLEVGTLGMDAVGQLDAILDLFERLGIEVRREQLGGAGGSLCRIHSRRVLFLDLDADVATQLDRCLDALSAVPEIDTVYVPPELRERVDARRGTGA